MKFNHKFIKKTSVVNHIVAEADSPIAFGFAYYLISKSAAQKLFPTADFSQCMVTTKGQYIAGYVEYYNLYIQDVPREALSIVAASICPDMKVFLDALPEFPTKEEYEHFFGDSIPVLQFVETLYIAPPFRGQGLSVEMTNFIDDYTEHSEGASVIGFGVSLCPLIPEDEHYNLNVDTRQPIEFIDMPAGEEYNQIKAKLQEQFKEASFVDGVYYYHFWPSSDVDEELLPQA